MLLEWAGSITCAVLRGVTRFATGIDMETDPKCLNAIELGSLRPGLLVRISVRNHTGVRNKPLSMFFWYRHC